MAAVASQTETRLGQIWAELLHGGPPQPDTDFFAAGGHSLLATRLLSRVEKEFGTHVALPRFYAEPTAGALVRAVAKVPDAPATSDAVRLGRGTAKPVFAVLHSNGAFTPLGQVIGQEHVFVALKAPDRRSGRSLDPTIEAIAARYVRQLQLVEPTGPYVLLGWCLAGNLAIEAAHQLRAAGQRVEAVVMVDTWNPAYFARMGRWRRRLAERSFGIQIILTEFGLALRGRITLWEFLRRRNAVRRLLAKPPAAMPVGPAGEAYQAGRAFDDGILAQLERAATQYRPKPFSGRVLRIRSSQEPRGFGLDRRYGWGRMVSDLRVASVPGDHLTVFLEPSITLLTERVREATGVASP